MLRLFTGLADEAAKFLGRLFGNSNVAKTEITELKNELQTLIDKVGKSEEKAEEAFSGLREIARKIEARAGADDITMTGAGARPSVDDLLEDLSSRTTASKEEVREALVNRANEAYAPGDPKRMRLDDDETLEAYIQSKKQMGAEDELIEDITDFIGMPPPSPGMQKIIQEEMRRARSLYDEFAEDEMLPFGRSGERKKASDMTMDEMSQSFSDATKRVKQRQADNMRKEELMANPDNFGKSMDELDQMVQDEKVIPFKPKKAEGGRIGAKTGLFTGIAEQAAKMFGDKGLMKILFDKVAGMRRADRIADTDQAKNIIRDPETDLERLKAMRDDEGNIIQRATPEGKMTIRDIEDLPRDLKYENPELRTFEDFIKREKVRAILADQLGVDPKDIPEENITMAIMEGMDLMATGGRVGFDAGGALQSEISLPPGFSLSDMNFSGLFDGIPGSIYDAKGSRLTPAQIEYNTKKQNFIRDNLPDTVIEDFKTSGFMPLGGDKAVTNHPILGTTNYATSGAFNKYIDSLYQDYQAKNMPTPTSAPQSDLQALADAVKVFKPTSSPEGGMAELGLAMQANPGMSIEEIINANLANQVREQYSSQMPTPTPVSTPTPAPTLTPPPSSPPSFTTSPGFRPTPAPGIDPLARAYQENAALYNQPLGSVGDVVGRIRKLAGFKQGGIANFFKERVK